MNKTLTVRRKIYDHIQNFSKCKWHNKCSHKEFETYCIAKDTIQDTGEALMAHREQGFVADVYRRYVEYYGVLQAVYMQQDAIFHGLFKLFMGSQELDFHGLSSWMALRDLRDDTVGHPVVRLKRLNRSAIGYDRVNYLWCPETKKSPWKSKDVNLARLLDTYDSEAANVLDTIFCQLEKGCATEHTQPSH